MSNNHTAVTIDDVQVVLDTHGSSRSRWPAAQRLRLAQILATDPQAQRLVEEACVFEQLLDLAPKVERARQENLSAQIMLATEIGSRRMVASDFLRSPQRIKTSYLPHAGAMLMAASLLLGIFVGANGQVTSAFDGVADLIGLSDDEPELASVNDQNMSGEDAL